jgi:hypothetical protein
LLIGGSSSGKSAGLGALAVGAGFGDAVTVETSGIGLAVAAVETGIGNAGTAGSNSAGAFQL